MQRGKKDQTPGEKRPPAEATTVPALVPTWWWAWWPPVVPLGAVIVLCIPGAVLDLRGRDLPWWATGAVSHVLVALLAVAVTAVYVCGKLHDLERAARAARHAGPTDPHKRGPRP